MAQHAPHLTIKRRLNVFGAYLLVVLLYVVLGGVIMAGCERDNEISRTQLSEQEIEQLQLSPKDLEMLEDAGFCSFPSRDAVQWTTGGAMFYSLTVITTIGYGSFAPKTLWGRVFTVIYALVGISVIGILLHNIASVGVQLVKSVLLRSKNQVPEDEATCAYRKTTRQLFADAQMSRRLSLAELKALIITTARVDAGAWDDEREGVILQDLRVLYQDDDGLFPLDRVFAALNRWYEIQASRPTPVPTRILFGTFGCCALWVFGWAAIFMAIEGWLYHDSVWFACITLSTIGFGDYVPSTAVGQILSFVFIAPGIGMVASFISCITNWFEGSRFWLLQRLFNRGLVSEKVLVAQGVKVCLHGEATKEAAASHIAVWSPEDACDGSYLDSNSPMASNRSFVSAFLESGGELGQPLTPRVVRTRARRDTIVVRGQGPMMLAMQSPRTRRSFVGQADALEEQSSPRSMPEPLKETRRKQSMCDSGSLSPQFLETRTPRHPVTPRHPRRGTGRWSTTPSAVGDASMRSVVESEADTRVLTPRTGARPSMVRPMPPQGRRGGRASGAAVSPLAPAGGDGFPEGMSLLDADPHRMSSSGFSISFEARGAQAGD